MKKLIFSIAITFMFSISNAGWTSNAKAIKNVNVSDGGGVWFQFIDATTRWQYFDLSKTGGKSMLSAVLTSKSTGLGIRIDEGTENLGAGPQGTGSTYECKAIEIE